MCGSVRSALQRSGMTHSKKPPTSWRQRPALTGIDKPMFFKGEVVGSTKKYSDRLLMFLLEAYNPKLQDSTKNARKRTKNARAGCGESRTSASEEGQTRSDISSYRRDHRQYRPGEGRRRCPAHRVLGARRLAYGVALAGKVAT